MNVPICQILPKSQTNRSFCQIMILIWTAVLTAAASAAAAEEDRTALIDHLRNWNGNVQPTKIVSWNAYSRQFIDAPTFKLLPMPKVTKYTAEVKQGQQSWQVKSDTPFLSLETIWPQMENKIFTLNFQWLDQAGTSLAAENSIRVKAPDWQGLQEPDADWRGAADRNMEYFIHTAWHGKAPYREPDMPVWIWSCASPTVTHDYWTGDFPDGYPMSYPCNTHALFIGGLLIYADHGRPQSEEAMRLARITADWNLKNRLPDSGAVPLFPYSTITNGQFGGGNEGAHITLLRASLLAIAYVDIYRATQHQPYLDYAIHIAKTTAKFQREDGSFPYRIDPQTGAVSEQYTPAAADFAALVYALEPYYYDPDLTMAAQRAIYWTIAQVCTSSYWKGVYEDVFPWPPFSNLSGGETQLFIRLLCQLKEQDPAFVPLARQLNRFVEDQFVIFSSESEAFIHPVKGLLHVKGPLVFEQFVCWYPMEAHAGLWIRTLIELHKATGEPVYLEKARAAANAICALQFEDGQFSTLGMRYYQDGKIISDKETGFNWYNCNVAASMWLYTLDAYVKSLSEKN
ncbi:MAG: hypothetical protein BWY71_01714 [Planctomycetes bacterium ADurb.Bin412]|nr:MAG: hypothetical protein BWY71_01714 [Planctomycetes bacterium ADurb.Bin412]